MLVVVLPSCGRALVIMMIFGGVPRFDREGSPQRAVGFGHLRLRARLRDQFNRLA